MLRSAFGVVIGAAVWMATFLALGILLARAWPDYAVHGREWFNAHIYSFSAPMSVLNALFWALAEICAGWLSAVVGKRLEASWALAALIGLYLAYQHLYAEWSNLPWWYNLAVALPAAPAVLCGGRLARGVVGRGRALAAG